MPTLQISPEQRKRYSARDAARREELERLYARREALEELIRSLETYQRIAPQRAACIPFSVGVKCS